MCWLLSGASCAPSDQQQVYSFSDGAQERVFQQNPSLW